MSSSKNFQLSTKMVTIPEPKAADEDAGGGDLAGRVEARLLGISDGPGQGIDGAVAQLGDEHQGRAQDAGGTSPTG